MGTADRRATRRASGSSRPPPAPRSLPADAAARRSRGRRECQSRKLGAASQPMRNSAAVRRRPASLRLPVRRPASRSQASSPGSARPRRRPVRCGSARAGRRRVRFTAPFNFSGNPTLSVPAGFSADGLPHGIQLVGPLLGEAVLCQVGHAYEQATEWHRRRPPVD